MNLTNLKIYRNVYGYTQEDLAKVLGVTKTSYANKETGRRKITLTEAKTMADLFDISIEELFFSSEVHIKDTQARKVYSNL